jgi:hypothetical protein
MHPEMGAALSRDELAAVLERVGPGTLFHDHLERTDATGRLHRMLDLDTQHWLPAPAPVHRTLW